MDWETKSRNNPTASADNSDSSVLDMSALGDGFASAVNPLDLQKFLAYTLLICKRQREPPLFTTEAQVYILDQKNETGSPWLETSSRPVALHLYHDLNRRSFRIISVEGSKPILNATISPSVSLKKGSSKFLQWADVKTNLVYGLGFTSDKEMGRFMDKVQEVQEMATQTYTSDSAPPPSETTEKFLDEESNISGNLGSDQMIKLENERLKAALAHSSANAKKWEEELRGLKEMNQQLTQALNKTRTPRPQNAVTAEASDKLDMEALLRHLATSLSPCFGGEGVSTSESRHPREILEEVEAVIRMNEDLQGRISQQKTASKDWMDSVSSLNEQIGQKLKELLNLHEKLSAHLQS